MNQQHTPLFDALNKHIQHKPKSFHVPGHKNGQVFLDKGKPIFQDILSMDVTELTGLDDLHSPEGVIREAEDLLANAYHTNKSFFLINGSTVGNLTMILASFEEGDVVFVQRNCHKSILNGLKLAKLQPIFIEPEWNDDWKVAVGILLKSIQSAYTAYPEGKGVILTYPNYYGFAFDIKGIIDFCHVNKMLVLVDEAHGAHFIAGEPFPLSAIKLGADMVVQSAHKTLPAMTMASFLHVNSNRVAIERVKAYLQILQSSSPSYPLMASLDLARSYIAMYSDEDKHYLMEQLTIFKHELNKIPQLKVLTHSTSGDPLKIVIQSRDGLSGYDLQTRLESVGIYTELADPNNVLIIFPLLKKNDSFPTSGIIKSIKQVLAKKENNLVWKDTFHNKQKDSYSALTISYKEQLKRSHEIIPISETVGRCSAEMVIPYPPGIPLLMEGEEVTADVLEELTQLVNLGSRFHGGEFLSECKLKVYK
ncbi:aminotransferase class I/II-fold pyridoxal phosphate-dependent enzyme [Neobacillus sp. D3-1R]|uniref:aminotransferase class I/II-fold pyridoxal phosphate-dependent enzyme n=1 Tax=Neobacillus sp. D3-1R TaxID=3445778 RepID=UPI003FA02F44